MSVLECKPLQHAAGCSHVNGNVNLRELSFEQHGVRAWRAAEGRAETFTSLTAAGVRFGVSANSVRAWARRRVVASYGVLAGWSFAYTTPSSAHGDE